jgi:hypothetical protein
LVDSSTRSMADRGVSVRIELIEAVMMESNRQLLELA